MADWDVILAPATVEVRVVLHEANAIMTSLRLLNIVDVHSGLADWVYETVDQLDEKRKAFNCIVAEVVDHVSGFSDVVSARENATFVELIKKLEKTPVANFGDSMIGWVRTKSENYPGDDVVLASAESYVDFVYELMGEKWAKKGHDFDRAEWKLRYDYLMNPEQLKAECIEHLNYMWDNYLKAEWKRVKPTLQEAVDAFAQVDFSNSTAFEAIEIVTGRNMRGKEGFDMQQVQVLTFVPSAHLGPYIIWGPSDHDLSHVLIAFGARLPQNATMKSAALGRNELLVRLNALADETRLKILELLTQHEELCAQDFITELDLSQSSASRHLRQLTASGFLTERRRDVAKCYALNNDRIDDTIRALKTFLNTE